MRWIGLIGIYKALALKPFLFCFTGIVNTFVAIFVHIFSAKSILKRILIYGLLIFAIAFLSVFFYVNKIWNEDISLKNLTEYRPVMSSQILDKNGIVIAEIAKEKRIFMPIENISKNVINAFISAEDRTFYENNGIDFMGIFRASVMNGLYFLEGRRLHGASTITQQVVRNTLLSNERTLARKLKEMVLSYKVSKIVSKDQIIQVYLNHIYLGQKSYGVEAASIEYFGKSAKDLSIEEAALIASLTKAPSMLDPRKGKSATLDRRNWIIKGMFEQGYINQKEMDEAIEKPIKLTQKKTTEKKPYSYIDYIIRYLESNKGITKDDLENNGYTIKTSFDSEVYGYIYKYFNEGIRDYDKRHGYSGPIGFCDKNFEKCVQSIDEPDLIANDQKIAVIIKIVDDERVEILTQNLKQGEILKNGFKWARPRKDKMAVGTEPKKSSDVFKVGDVVIVSETEGVYSLSQIPDVNGGIVVMEPKTGKIYSMMGGYLDVPGAFNRVTQAKRQPGSTAKIFSYLTALESGFKLNDVILDSEIQIATGNGTAWMPKNSTNNFSNGLITVRRAFEKSLNAPLARIMNEVGPRKLVNLLKRLDVASEAEESLATSLGSFETTLLAITRGFSTMINMGEKIIDDPIISITQNKEGEKFTSLKSEITTEKEDEDAEKILDDLSENLIFGVKSEEKITKERSYQVCSLLEGGVKRGTSSKFSISPNLFGKTGTSNDAKDVWFIGGSSDFMIGVYIGKDIPATLGANEYGSVTALPIAKNVMSMLIKIKTPEPLEIPDGVKFVNVNLETGEIVKKHGSSYGEKVISEVFLKTDKIESEDSYLKKIDQQDGSSSGINMGVY